jgi:hypothetical protein
MCYVLSSQAIVQILVISIIIDKNKNKNKSNTICVCRHLLLDFSPDLSLYASDQLPIRLAFYQPVAPLFSLRELFKDALNIETIIYSVGW